MLRDLEPICLTHPTQRSDSWIFIARQWQAIRANKRTHIHIPHVRTFIPLDRRIRWNVEQFKSNPRYGIIQYHREKEKEQRIANGVIAMHWRYPCPVGNFLSLLCLSALLLYCTLLCPLLSSSVALDSTVWDSTAILSTRDLIKGIIDTTTITIPTRTGSTFDTTINCRTGFLWPASEIIHLATRSGQVGTLQHWSRYLR